MKFNDLLMLLQYETQKSYDLVDSIAQSGDQKNDLNIRIAMESVEIEIPVIFYEGDAKYDPADNKDQPDNLKHFSVPYTVKTTVNRRVLPREPVSGKVLETRIIGPPEKTDDNYSAETIGRIRIVLKPVIK